MHIVTKSTIKGAAKAKSRTQSSYKPGLAADEAKKEIQSLKMSPEEEKRLSKIKDAIIAAEKWKNVKLKKANTLLQKKVDNGLATIAKLKENLRIAKLPKNSSNSSRAPSTDLYKPKRSKDLSLREKSGKKTGGQQGHKGTTLAFSINTRVKLTETNLLLPIPLSEIQLNKDAVLDQNPGYTN